MTGFHLYIECMKTRLTHITLPILVLLGFAAAPAQASVPDPASCSVNDFPRILTAADNLTEGANNYSDEYKKLVLFSTNVKPHISSLPGLPAKATRAQKAAYKAAQEKEERTRTRLLNRAVKDLERAKDRALEDADTNLSERGRAIEQNFDAAEAAVGYLQDCINTRAEQSYVLGVRSAEDLLRGKQRSSQDSYISQADQVAKAQREAMAQVRKVIDDAKKACRKNNKLNPVGLNRPSAPKNKKSKKQQAAYRKRMKAYNNAVKSNEKKADKMEDCQEEAVENPDHGLDARADQAEAAFNAQLEAHELAYQRASEDADVEFQRAVEDLDRKFGSRKQIEYQEAIRLLGDARETAEAISDRLKVDEVRSIEDAYSSSVRYLEDLYDVDLES